MRRLFYVTNDLNDAEEISKEVHSAGIDDHHFFVLSRDEKGLKTHHLHGSPRLEKSHIIAAGERQWLLFVMLVVLIVITYFVIETFPLMNANAALILSLVVVFSFVVAFSRMAKSFDGYFIQMFRQRLDNGEVVIIIDVAKVQAQSIEKIMNNHEKAKFIADSTNLGSPLPD